MLLHLVWVLLSPLGLGMERILAFHNFVTAEERGICRFMFCPLVPNSVFCGASGLSWSLDSESWGKTGPSLDESLVIVAEALGCFYTWSGFSPGFPRAQEPSMRPMQHLRSPFPMPAKPLCIRSTVPDLPNMLLIRLASLIIKEM